MIVEKYISQLLFEHDCIVVPGFGAFIAEYSGAEISYVRNKITPPYKKIAFNEKIVTDDGLLVNAIIHCENKTQSEAELLIFEWMRHIKQELALQKQYTFEQIGKLYFNNTGLLSFEQFTKYNYLSESFGLPDLYFKPIDRTNDKQNIFKTTNNDSMAANSDLYPDHSHEEDEEIQSNADSDENTGENGYYNSPKKKNSGLAWYYVSAVLALLLVVGTSLFINGTNDGKNLAWSSIVSKLFGGSDENRADNKLLPDSESAPPEETPTESEDSYPNDYTAPTPLPSASSGNSSEADLRASITDAINYPSSKFYVIAGSFNKVKRAQRFAKQLTNEGTPSRLIITGELSEPVKVAIGEFNSYEEATARKEELKQTFGPDIWVFAY